MKKLSANKTAEYGFLLESEFEALTRLEKVNVPRVVKCYDVGICSDGATCLLLE